MKRPDSEKQYEVASKKLKLSQSASESEARLLISTKETQSSFTDSSKPVDVPSVAQPVSGPCDALPVDGNTQSREGANNHHSTKSKVKKKKKRKKEDLEVVATDPTSTTSTPDHLRYNVQVL